MEAEHSIVGRADGGDSTWAHLKGVSHRIGAGPGHQRADQNPNSGDYLSPLMGLGIPLSLCTALENSCRAKRPSGSTVNQDEGAWCQKGW